MDKQARFNLLSLLKRREVLMADCVRGVEPLIVCHHPQLPETSPEEITQARMERRRVIHVRVERAEAGFLVAKVEREQESHIVWSREEDAPLTQVEVFNLGDGTRTVVMESAHYGAGCRVVETEL